MIMEPHDAVGQYELSVNSGESNLTRVSFRSYMTV